MSPSYRGFFSKERRQFLPALAGRSRRRNTIMSVKIFILGRPGSGKSTAARYLNTHFRRLGWSTRHINDYDILKRMFLEDVGHKRFQPTPNNGFDATDLTVLDEALKEVEWRVDAYAQTTNLVTIEFARDDYRHALRQFQRDFLQGAHFLFMDADVETCLTRVHERVTHASGTDDHPSFSDDIFRCYYAADSRPYIQYVMQREFSLHKHIKVINNTGPLEDCLRDIQQFADLVCTEEEMMAMADCAD